MKSIEITPMPTNGNTRHYKVVLRTSKGKNTLITSNKVLINIAQTIRQAIGGLERLRRTTKLKYYEKGTINTISKRIYIFFSGIFGIRKSNG